MFFFFEFIIFLGENKQALENQYLTSFNFPIPKTRRGPPGVAVTVTFAIGAGGMIRVTTDADEENEHEQLKHQYLLMFVIFLLMGMLFFLRMHPEMFRDKIDQWETHRRLVDGAQESSVSTATTAEYDEFEFIEPKEL